MPIKILSTCLVYVVSGWGIHSGRAQYWDELGLTLSANNGITLSVFTAVLWFFNPKPMITAAKLKHQRISQAGAERKERDFTSINLAAVWACVCREVFTKWYMDGAVCLSTLYCTERLLNPRSINEAVLTSIWATHFALFQCYPIYRDNIPLEGI